MDFIVNMRVLVAFEGIRCLYADTLCRAIRDLRPAVTVRWAVLGELERELSRFDPHVVVCSQPSGVHPGARGAWVKIPTGDGLEDDERLSDICLDGKHWKSDGPPLKEMLEVLDETEERLREGSLSETC